MPRTHAELNKEFRLLGQRLGRLLASDFARQDLRWVGDVRGILSPVSGAHRDANLWKLVCEALHTGLRENFEAGYRGVQKNTDENVSTSSVRELLHGVVDGLHAAGVGPFSAGLDELCDVLVGLFEGLSRIRLATRFTGFQYRDSLVRMQHAAPRGVELFGANVSGDGSAALHDELDRLRREKVLDAMTQMADAGAPVSRVFQAAAAAALAFTLNAMAAPASAANQRLRSNARPEEVALQMQWRELLKQLAGPLGVQQMPGTQAWDAPWISQFVRGSISPRRDPALRSADPLFAQPSSAPVSSAPWSSAPVSSAPWSSAPPFSQASAPQYEREPDNAWDLLLNDFGRYMARPDPMAMPRPDPMAAVVAPAVDPARLWDLVLNHFDAYIDLPREVPATLDEVPQALMEPQAFALPHPSAPMEDAMEGIEYPPPWSPASLAPATAPPVDDADDFDADVDAVTLGPDANALQQASLAGQDSAEDEGDADMLDLPDLAALLQAPGLPAAAQAGAAGDGADEELVDAMLLA